MKKIFTVALLFIFAIQLSSCRGCGGDEYDPLAEAVSVLANDGIELTSAEVKGKDVVVVYEASNADQYDDQIVEVWGKIFGIMSWIAEENVVIINTAGEIPMVSLTASVDEIHQATAGAISTKRFMAGVKIRALEEEPEAGE